MGFLIAAVTGLATGYALVLLYRRAFQVTSFWRAAFALPFGALILGSLGLAQWPFSRSCCEVDPSWNIGMWFWFAGVMVWFPALRRAYQSRAKITNPSFRRGQ